MTFGFISGTTCLSAPSSHSMTAIFPEGLPVPPAAQQNSAVTPDSRFAPDLLAKTFCPDSVNADSSILAVVVLPFVPVTTMISIPSDTSARTSFLKNIATLPGSAVPPPRFETRRNQRTALHDATAAIVLISPLPVKFFLFSYQFIITGSIRTHLGSSHHLLICRSVRCRCFIIHVPPLARSLAFQSPL